MDRLLEISNLGYLGVGCSQYGKTEIDKYPCQGGYQCCTKNKDYAEPYFNLLHTQTLRNKNFCL